MNKHDPIYLTTVLTEKISLHSLSEQSMIKVYAMEKQIQINISYIINRLCIFVLFVIYCLLDYLMLKSFFTTKETINQEKMAT